MGCDIHGVFQARNNDHWVDIPHNYEHGRHYYLFAMLADVRNGFGFAGVSIFEPLEPIAQPRGLPDDFQMDGETHLLASMAVMDPRRRGYYNRYPVTSGADDEEENPLEYWMGDHSHSWLLGTEILAYAEGLRNTRHRDYGVVSLEQFRRWDGQSEPDDHCGGIMGHGIVTLDPEGVRAMETAGTPLDVEKTYVRIAWDKDALENVTYFFDEVARLVDEHGEVRYVFGFDN